MTAAATIDRPVRAAEMGKAEAEAITQAIKDNFDSLGSMLQQARDRKAYKALGYKTFETYCKTEFGKSISNAYRLIEDAKVVAQIESEISKQYDEPITLTIPGSHLRPLKELPEMGDKLRAIEYAQKLATAEGKKPSKKHLEIAVFEVSGKRSEDYRKAIQDLGFQKGTRVELIKTIGNNNRGTVKKIDKRGKIDVELDTAGAVPISCEASELRILSDTEKPTNPITDEYTVSKGDRVIIFAKGLEGKKGTIFTYKIGKQALVVLDGEKAPISISYAELELINESKADGWDAEIVWESREGTYYYFPQEDTIYNNKWPKGLYLKPESHNEKSPIKFIESWENIFAGTLIGALTTPSRTKSLAISEAMKMAEEERMEFIDDLVGSLTQLLPTTDKAQKAALSISFSKTIAELVSGKKTQTRRAWQDDYAKSFIRYFEEGTAIPALNKGRHRGGSELGHIRLIQRPYQQYLSEMSPIDLQEEGGMVATVQEFIDTYFEGQDKLVWVLHFEFLSAPNNSNDAATLTKENQRLREQLADAESAIEAMVNAASTVSTLEPTETTDLLVKNAASTASVAELEQTAEFLVKNIAEISTPGDTAAHTELPPKILEKIVTEREIALSRIENYEKSKGGKTKEKEIQNINGNIGALRRKLETLERYEQLRIGRIVCHEQRPMILGKVHSLDFSQGGMPCICVNYFKDGELEKTSVSENGKNIFAVDL